MVNFNGVFNEKNLKPLHQIYNSHITTTTNKAGHRLPPNQPMITLPYKFTTRLIDDIIPLIL